MWIPIAITVVVIAFALSPVMMMAPTKKQKRIALLREQARQLGLSVQLVSPPTGANLGENAQTMVPRYVLAWLSEKDLTSEPESPSKANNKGDNELLIRAALKRQINWILVKGKLDHELHFEGLWQWVKEIPRSEALLATVRKLIEKIPSDCFALATDSYGVSLYWFEEGEVEQVELVREVLVELKSECLSQLGVQE